MLSTKQQEWVDHLSNDGKIKIVPYDPSCEEKYESIKEEVQKEIGEKNPVLHMGASDMGISGQDEIDIYVPVSPGKFNEIVSKIEKLFGSPESHYELERARFSTEIEGKHIDVFVINKESYGWISNVKFHTYVKSKPVALEEYRKLKESMNGLGTRDYYREKIEFINKIIEKISDV
jgi:GrpB-like predicted nucleotidyltransferase (UPF0157 family)